MTLNGFRVAEQCFNGGRTIWILKEQEVRQQGDPDIAGGLLGRGRINNDVISKAYG